MPSKNHSRKMGTSRKRNQSKSRSNQRSNRKRSNNKRSRKGSYWRKNLNGNAYKKKNNNKNSSRTPRIRRKGYYRRSQSGKRTYVPASYIRKTSAGPIRRSTYNKKVLERRKRSQNKARKMYGNKKCPSGKILREGYVRKSYNRKNGVHVKGIIVAPTCIPDQGAQGKGPKLIKVLKKGELKKYGYTSKLSEKNRHMALDKAVKAEGPLVILRRLTPIATLTKKTSPKSSKIFEADKVYIQKKYFRN